MVNEQSNAMQYVLGFKFCDVHRKPHLRLYACVHGSTNETNGIPISFKVIPIVPLVIPLVPMVML